MTLPIRPHVPNLSGERFRVVYRIAEAQADAEQTALSIANEQTVEFPDEVVPDGDIREQVMGRVEALDPDDSGDWLATISYAVETAGSDLPQLFNVVIGLTSLLSTVRAERLDLPDALLDRFNGPRFGIDGIREIVGVWERPLLCTSLKPMGLTSDHLADQAYRCALGGLDILKDDHGITDLPFAPFEERVPRIAEAVAEANAETGFNCLYAANITASADQIGERAHFARDAGAGALMLSPALTGFDAVRVLADDPDIGLPLLSHPTFGGSNVAGDSASFSHRLYYGQFHRLAGADISIYANAGGRFPVSVADSHGAAAGCREPMGSLKPIFPMIGGGMTLDRGHALRAEYGMEAIFLVGGGLHTAGDDLTATVRRFIEIVS
jgi:ribulose-bisphosphate carboxylase large chain